VLLPVGAMRLLLLPRPALVAGALRPLLALLLLAGVLRLLRSLLLSHRGRY
jgi:hypothetical protein